MRILPRSARGTWLLAAVAWLGACLAVWQLLPERPRFVIAATRPVCPRQFSIDGCMLLTQEYGAFDSSGRLVSSGRPSRSDATSDPYRVWDVLTGRCVANWPPDERNAVITDLAPDGVMAVATEYRGNETSWAYLDLRTNQHEPLPWPPHGPNEFTADGRWLAYVNRSDGKTKTIWWDRRDRRAVTEFAGVELEALAADGRWVSTDPAVAAGQPSTLTFREFVTGREISQCQLARPFGKLSFSPRGDHLIVNEGSRGEQSIIEVSSGRVVVQLPTDPLRGVIGLFPRETDFVWPPGVGEVVAVEQNGGGVSLARYDLRTGVCLNRSTVEENTNPYKFFNRVTPVPGRGLFVICSPDIDHHTRLREWLERMPILGPTLRRSRPYLAVYDARFGMKLSQIRLDDGQSEWTSPDGQTLLVQKNDGKIEVWDLPPRPPLIWFAIAAAILTLPLAGLAWRSSRRLRREVA